MSAQLIPSNTRMPQLKHQISGSKFIVENPVAGNFDEMGSGKTKQVIDAACCLFETGEIDKVIVVAPVAVRSVWFNMHLGELQKHLWQCTPARVIEYHQKKRAWDWGDTTNGRKLFWLITNYDFIRQDHRLEPLLQAANQRTMLVLDESSAVKSRKAKQTKACERIREKCGRIIILNGTPISQSPNDIYSQANLMDPRILGVRSYFQFRARYAVMGGWHQKQIIGWRNMEDLQSRLKPYVMRRLKKDCLDLPEKIPSVPLVVSLTEATWKIYKQMRDDMIVWLESAESSMASQAVVKSLRLAQICSGFLGGLKLSDDDAPETREVGNEKTNHLLMWLEDRLTEDPYLKLLVWCRFAPELRRLKRILEKNKKYYGSFAKKYQLTSGVIAGGQNVQDRERSLRLLDPRTAPKGPVVVLGNPKAGGLGLNLAASHTVVYLSNDYSLMTRLQSEDRVHRTGQVEKVSYFDVIAVGPNGEKTVDMIILEALKNKNDLAQWTMKEWVERLTEE